MNNSRNKTTITIALILTIAITLSAFPIASAQDDEVLTKATIAYLGAIPNPVGVNQDVLLHVGITDYRSSADQGWEGITVSVIDPTGHEETLGPFTTDSTGGTGALFTPTIPGEYTLQTHFPEQTVEVAPSHFGLFSGTVTYLASESEEITLTVLEDAIPYYPGHSLPNEYWDRPIDAQLREWASVAGSWVRDPDNLYAPYNDGPETSHIIWTKELTTGGLTGGELGGTSYGTGDAYEGKWPVRFILAGRLYYEVGGARPDQPTVTHCVDLNTGEEIWSKVFMDNQSISFGQILYWTGFNYHGAFPYLWVSAGGNWYAHDAYTGDWMFTIENVPSGTTVYDENNAIYIVNVDTTNARMTVWSMNALCLSQAVGSGLGSWGNQVHQKVFDAEAYPDAFTTNVTIEEGLIGSVSAASYGDRVIGAVSSTAGVTMWGLSLAAGDEGDLLFNETWDAPAYWAEANLTVTGAMGGWAAWSFEDKVAVLYARETREHFGFSLETGEYMWGPTPSEHYLNALEDSPSYVRHIAYGRLYSASVGGILYCYDVETGDLLWTYEANDPYSEMLWSNNWWIKPLFITDGKIYISHTEHSSVDPRPRGAPFVCLDAITGDVIFRIDGAFRTTRWGGRAIIGDSIIMAMNTYDQRLYAISKGPTAMTVEAPLLAANIGSSVTIRGSVMDVSPGTADTVLAARFPNGVPAVSDASMNDWMKYVYMQFERPADAVGVNVKLEAIDPNGNYQSLGTTTTDSYGNYGFAFAPDTEGTYTIIATFDGSESYYGSTETTYLTVDPALAASTPMEPDTETPETPDTQTPDTETPDTETPATEAPLISTEVAIIAAVAVACVIGVAAFFALRKRK